MKLFTNMKTGAVLAATAIAPLALPGVVAADAKEEIIKGVDFTGPASTTSLDSVISTAINLISLVVGVIAVIMVIIGGLKYITSNGDANSISSAKTTIIYALVGLVVVAVAQVIVRFVLAKI